MSALYSLVSTKKLSRTQAIQSFTADPVFHYEVLQKCFLHKKSIYVGARFRSRLSDISALEGDSYNDEIKVEEKTLHTEIGTLEQRYKSAVLSEADEQGELEKRVAGNPDAEQRERNRASIKSVVNEFLSSPSTRQDAFRRRSRALRRSRC